MIKEIFRPTGDNTTVYLNALFLLMLLVIGVADAFMIVITYFLETVIIGLIHVVKLFLTVKHGKPPKPDSKGFNGYGVILFFIFHYGIFVSVQSAFVFGFFGVDTFSSQGVFDAYWDALLSPGMLMALASILFTNLSYFFTNFWKPKKYRDYGPDEIFMKPYLRIIIQQFVVIIAAFFLVVLNAGLAAAILLIVLRLAVDLTIIGIKSDSTLLKKLAIKLSKTPEEIPQIEKSLEQFTE